MHKLVHIVEIRLRSAQVMGSALDERTKPPGGSMRFPRQRGKLRRLGGRIFHNVDEHRAGPSAARDGECLAHDVRKLGRIAHHVVAFGDGHGDARDVNLLKRVLAHEVFRHIAGDEYHGGRVHISRGDACGEVGAPRAGGGEAHAYLAGGTGIAVRCMGSALLMGGENMPNFAAIVVKLVINVQDGAAGVAKNGIHTLFQQAFHQDFCACHLHV